MTNVEPASALIATPLDNDSTNPTPQEIRAWLIGTVHHVQHIEYYLEQLRIGKEDPQRPHDIIGYGNKFEWEVIKGFAIQYRERSQEFFERHVKPSLERHRHQYHHVKWNEQNPTATHEDMKLGAVDAICSLLEPDRTYQGGKHTAIEIETIIEKNPEHKQPWLRLIHAEIQKIEPPQLSIIRNLQDFPNIGIHPTTYNTLKARVHDTLIMLHDHDYNV